MRDVKLHVRILVSKTSHHWWFFKKFSYESVLVLLVSRSICAGQLLNGFAGPVTQAGPTLLSSAWFPPKQRTTATAVAALCGSLGVAMSFVIGPSFVHDVKSDLDILTPVKANISSNLRYQLLVVVYCGILE